MKHTINKVTGANLFMVCSSVKQVEIEINQLSFLARQHYLMRDYKAVTAIAQRLIAIPGRAERIGQYYLALVMCRQGAEEKELALSLLNNLANCPDPKIRSNAYVSLASRQVTLNNFEEAIYLAKQANTISLSNDWCAPLATLQLQNLLGVMLSIKGDHKSSLAVFSKNITLAKYFGRVYPTLYLDSLNSLALELREDGQDDYAQHIIKKVAASPCFIHYPEWQESYREIVNPEVPLQKPRNFIAGLPGLKPSSTKKKEQLKKIEKVVNIAAYIRATTVTNMQHNDTGTVSPFRPKNPFVRRREYNLFFDAVLIDSEGKELVAYSLMMDNYPTENYIDLNDQLERLCVGEVVGVETVTLEIRLVSEQGEIIDVMSRDTILESELDTLFEILGGIDDWIVQPYFDDDTPSLLEVAYNHQSTEQALLQVVLKKLEQEYK